jgi:hypothetical protein
MYMSAAFIFPQSTFDLLSEDQELGFDPALATIVVEMVTENVAEANHIFPRQVHGGT